MLLFEAMVVELAKSQPVRTLWRRSASTTPACGGSSDITWTRHARTGTTRACRLCLFNRS